jgi:replication-associated recombination protein RarA
VISSEDVGLAEPTLPATIAALYGMWTETRKKKKGSAPERLYLVQAVLHLVRARKSRIVDDALWAHYGTDERLYEIPDVALDVHTQRGRALGRGEDFLWSESYRLENEHPELPNPYTERAKTVPAGEFKEVDSRSVKAEVEAPFETLDQALADHDADTATPGRLTRPQQKWPRRCDEHPGARPEPI